MLEINSSTQRQSKVKIQKPKTFENKVYSLLEGGFTVLVVNAQHIKNVPGRKTDVKDAEAIVAVAHRILKAAYHILLKQEVYRDLGANYLDSCRTDKVLNGLRRRIEQLGYQVSLEPTPQA